MKLIKFKKTKKAKSKTIKFATSTKTLIYCKSNFSKNS